jgi:hypothetical protein
LSLTILLLPELFLPLAILFLPLALLFLTELVVGHCSVSFPNYHETIVLWRDITVERAGLGRSLSAFQRRAFRAETWQNSCCR